MISHLNSLQFDNKFAKLDFYWSSQQTQRQFVVYKLLCYYNLCMVLKFGYSEKATKFEKIFHVKFDITEQRQILSGRFFQILWPSQNIQTLIENFDKSAINYFVTQPKFHDY